MKNSSSGIHIAQVQFRVDREKDLQKFVKYLSHPWHIMWRNFLAGTFHGIGFLVGSALVLALISFVLQQVLGEIPFFSDAAKAINVWLQMTMHARQ